MSWEPQFRYYCIQCKQGFCYKYKPLPNPPCPYCGTFMWFDCIADVYIPKKVSN